jgi:hypothetical protein
VTELTLEEVEFIEYKYSLLELEEVDLNGVVYINFQNDIMVPEDLDVFESEITVYIDF